MEIVQERRCEATGNKYWNDTSTVEEREDLESVGEASMNELELSDENIRDREGQ